MLARVLTDCEHVRAQDGVGHMGNTVCGGSDIFCGWFPKMKSGDLFSKKNKSELGL